MTDTPEPPVPADADLRDFPYTPIIRGRLFGSSFHARATDAEWRAGVTLWLKSWEQVPAGSLPDDDIDLCRLAELGRDLKTWRKVKEGALRGWYRCSDGRLYHGVVAEVVLEAYGKRRSASDKGKLGALKRWGAGNASATPGDSSANGSGIHGNGTGMAGAMPGDSKGNEEKREKNPPTPLAGGLPALSRPKSPERQRRDQSRGAWIQAELARKGNDFEGLKRRDPVIAEAIRIIGGFHVIGMTPTDKMPTVRARFRETYEHLLERALHESTPPGGTA